MNIIDRANQMIMEILMECHYEDNAIRYSVMRLPDHTILITLKTHHLTVERSINRMYAVTYHDDDHDIEDLFTIIRELFETWLRGIFKVKFPEYYKVD